MVRAREKLCNVAGVSEIDGAPAAPGHGWRLQQHSRRWQEQWWEPETTRFSSRKEGVFFFFLSHDAILQWLDYLSIMAVFFPVGLGSFFPFSFCAASTCLGPDTPFQHACQAQEAAWTQGGAHVSHACFGPASVLRTVPTRTCAFALRAHFCTHTWVVGQTRLPCGCAPAAAPRMHLWCHRAVADHGGESGGQFLSPMRPHIVKAVAGGLRSFL